MKKKGQTESYSFLIGLFLTFLLLTGVGCAMYSIYSSKLTTKDSFESLTKLIEESKNEDTGDIAMFVDKSQFIIGFDYDVQEENFRCLIDGLTDGQFTVGDLDDGISDYDDTGATGDELLIPIKITKPDIRECKDQACICLCKKEPSKDVASGDKKPLCGDLPTCKGFDNIKYFAGGRNCERHLAIGGTDELINLAYLRDKSLFSLDDSVPTTYSEYISSKEPQVLAQYTKTQRDINRFLEDFMDNQGELTMNFIPVNWEEAVTSDMDKFSEESFNLGRALFSKGLNFLQTSFKGVDFNKYIKSSPIPQNCKIEDLTALSKKPSVKTYETAEETYQTMKSCYEEYNPDNKGRYSPNYVHLFNIPLGMPDQIDPESKIRTRDMVSFEDDDYNTGYWLARMVGFCDESNYDSWKKMNQALGTGDSTATNFKYRECLNPYPLCCKDHEEWGKKGAEEYVKYLEKSNLAWNCYPEYKSEFPFESEAKYLQYIKSHQICIGHVCTIDGNDNCRGLMGPKFSETEKKIFGTGFVKDISMETYKFPNDDFRRTETR